MRHWIAYVGLTLLGLGYTAAGDGPLGTSALAQSFSPRPPRSHPQARSYLETNLVHWQYQSFNGDVDENGTKLTYKDSRQRVATADLLNTLSIVTHMDSFALRVQPGIIVPFGSVALGYEIPDLMETGLRLVYRAATADAKSDARKPNDEISRGDMEVGPYAHFFLDLDVIEAESSVAALYILGDGETFTTAGADSIKSESSGFAVSGSFDLVFPVSESADIISGLALRYSSQSESAKGYKLNQKVFTARANLATLRIKF